MKFKFIEILAIALFLLITKETQAQTVLNGTVCDRDTKAALPDVLIRVRHKKQLAISGKSGNFNIPASKNDLLIFTARGYVPDTLYLVDLTAKRIEMIAAVNALNEVLVTASTSEPAFDPEKEYPEVYEKSKFALSPSRLLGRDARNARRLKHYFDNERRQRKIDSIFNVNLVGSIIPLKGRDLRNFMLMYRPHLSFLNKSSPDDLYKYIKNCYSKFTQLTPRERAPAKLY